MAGDNNNKSVVLKRHEKPKDKTKRKILDRQTKELMIGILIRNPDAFAAMRDSLKHDSFADYDQVFRVAWTLTCEYVDENNQLPDHEFLVAAVSNATNADPDLLNATETDEMNQLLDFIFADKTYKREVEKDSGYVAYALRVAKQYLHERLAARARDVIMNKDYVPVDMPDVLSTFHEESERIASLDTDEILLAFPEGFEKEVAVQVFSTGVDFIDKFLGGGHAPGEVYGLLGPYGSCKCLGKGTLVLMFDGTTKKVEVVRAGDLLMGPDSKPRRVLSVGRGREMLYRVTPTKGDSYVVNESHILSLKRSPRKGGEAHQIINIAVRDYMRKGSHFKHQHLGWRVGVDFAEQWCGVDPYFLGLWLGDGHAANTRVTTADPEVVAYLSYYAKINGLRLQFVADTGKAATWAIVGPRSGVSGSNCVLSALRKAGVLDNKHIPQAYLANSRNVRLQVLAGLLDADGCYAGGCYQFANSNLQLIDDVVFLARSLGYAAYKKERKVMCCNNGKECDSAYVTISGDLSDLPCKIARRKPSSRRQKKDVLVTGIKVEAIGEGDYYGFEIDGDRLFLLGDFTVTHNTTLVAQMAVEACLRFSRDLQEHGGKPKVAIIVSYEAPLAEMRSRCLGYGAKIHRSTLEGLKALETDLSHTGNLKKYEKQLFKKAIARGQVVNGEYERMLPLREIMNQHLVLIDMTGGTRKGVGGGGVAEVARRVTHELRRRGADCGAGWIDYTNAMVRRQMEAEGASNDQLRHYIGSVPFAVKHKLSQAFSSPWWLLQQLNGEVNSRGSASLGHHTDAAEAKNFAENLDFAFPIGVPDKIDNVALFGCTKHRRTAGKDHTIIQILGAMNKVKGVNDKWVLNSHTKKLMRRDDAVRLPGGGDEAANEEEGDAPTPENQEDVMGDIAGDP